jgi:hypothetical protein
MAIGPVQLLVLGFELGAAGAAQRNQIPGMRPAAA